MSSKLSDYQLCSMLKGITRNPDFDINASLSEDDLLEVLFFCDNFKSSFCVSDLHVIRDRYPIYVEFNKGERSVLIDSLKEHMNMVAIVSDSIKSGRDGLFFVLVTDDFHSVAVWLSVLSDKNMYCCEIDDTYYVCSPVHSFVT
jgi:hypothetical protein